MSTDEGRTLEHGAVHRFLFLYNQRASQSYRLLRLQDRPDAILEADDGSLLGVEVTHLFADSHEASAFVGRSVTTNGNPPTMAILVDRLNALLEKKERKGRGFACPYPVLLVVRCASEAFTGPDFEASRSGIRVPAGAYHETWLLARDRRLPGWPHLLRLG